MTVTPRAAALALAALALASTFVPSWKRPPSSRAPPSDGGRPVRVGLVFDVGGRGDKSFNDSAYDGLSRAERELGIDASFLEPVGSEDRESALRLFAARGMDLVIGVGFIFTSDIDAVARAYPGVHFACVDYAGDPAKVPVNVI